MNKLFLLYDEALELKKIGFDDYCFGYYEIQDKNLVINYNNIPLNTEQEKRPGLYKIDNQNSTLPQWAIAAPIYSQAFKFFREKHKLAGMPDIGNQEFSYKIFDLNKDKSIKIVNFNGSFEEAEMACLKNLIKIVGQK